jgi:hypothetical protein
MLAIDPTYADGVRALANALYAKGASVETVRTLLHRAHAADAGAGGERLARLDAAHVAILAGDFVAAEKIARGMAEDAQGSVVAARHGVPARLLAAIDHESGRDADAAAVARAYLEGRDAWEPAPAMDDWAMNDEPTPAMLAARLRIGDLSRADYDAEIAKTVARWTARASPSTRNFVWIYAYATPTETPADAEIAVARRADFEPVPKFKPLSLADEAIGRTYLLAGRTDDAVTTLSRATQSCYPLDFPIERGHPWSLRRVPRGARAVGERETAIGHRRAGGGADDGAEVSEVTASKRSRRRDLRAPGSAAS